MVKKCLLMNSELDNLIEEAWAIGEDAKKLFGELNAAQLNWQPRTESWSVGLCLEHLMRTNEGEFAEFEKVAAGDYQNPLWGKVPFLSDFFGNFVLKAVAPQNPKKIKHPKVFAPARSQVPASIVDEFVRHQQAVVGYFERCADVDLRKTIVQSPVARVVTYRLLDAFKIVVTHERRHFAQAERVMAHENFPTA